MHMEENMRKKVVTSMIVGMALLMTACSSNGGKSTFSEKDLETISEKQAEEAIIKVAEQAYGGKGDESKGNEETEEPFNPQELGISVSDVDPYEENLFEIFGLDNDFPKPKDGFEQKWKYTTSEYPMNKQTGEQKDGIGEYKLNLELDPNYYDDYKNKIIEYLKGKHNLKLSHDGKWLGVGNAYLEGDRKIHYQFEQKWLTMILNPQDRRSVTGEIIDIETADAVENVAENYPKSITIRDADGNEVEFWYTAWADMSFDELKHEYITWEHLPQIGEKVKIEYNCSYAYIEENNLDGNNIRIVNIEFIN